MSVAHGVPKTGRRSPRPPRKRPPACENRRGGVKTGSSYPGPRLKSEGPRALGMVKVLPHVGPVNTQAPYIVPLCTSGRRLQGPGFKGPIGPGKDRERVEKKFCRAEVVVFPLNTGRRRCGCESKGLIPKRAKPTRRCRRSHDHFLAGTKSAGNCWEHCRGREGGRQLHKNGAVGGQVSSFRFPVSRTMVSCQWAVETQDPSGRAFVPAASLRAGSRSGRKELEEEGGRASAVTA